MAKVPNLRGFCKACGLECLMSMPCYCCKEKMRHPKEFPSIDVHRDPTTGKLAKY